MQLRPTLHRTAPLALHSQHSTALHSSKQFTSLHTSAPSAPLCTTSAQLCTARHGFCTAHRLYNAAATHRYSQCIPPAGACEVHASKRQKSIHIAANFLFDETMRPISSPIGDSRKLGRYEGRVGKCVLWKVVRHHNKLIISAYPTSYLPYWTLFKTFALLQLNVCSRLDYRSWDENTTAASSSEELSLSIYRWDPGIAQNIKCYAL
jgi:hypothetical protein